MLMPRYVVILLVTFGALSADATVAAPRKPLSFEAHVRPILKAHCFQCHGEEEQVEGSLDLRLVRLMRTGGDSGPALVAGDAAKSLMVERLESGEMPPGEKNISADELATIRRWINAGAETARPEPENAEEQLFTEEDRLFWSFQPVREPNVPQVQAASRVRTPVDTFLLARLEEEGLGFSPDADKRTLIRRAYFDLWGLPPTPEAVDEFLADHRPDAWPRLIDRLLASPHYGERWGRHWLDIAGYADSDGYSEQDRVRAFAYKYRDYVIRAHNADKPFDEFIQEQLAGDELVERPYRNLSALDQDRLIATGFLRNAPDGTADRAVDQAMARNEVMAETITIVSSSLLGLTVQCARCHNHRFDPISHVDYHRLRAIFEPAYDWKAWRLPEERRVSLWSDAERELAAEVDAELAKAAQKRADQLKRHMADVLEIELAKLPNSVQVQPELIRDAVLQRTAKERTPEQIAILKKYPSLNISEQTLGARSAERFLKESKGYEALVKQITARRPKPDYARALTEVPGELPVTYRFGRGSHAQPEEVVLPGELSILNVEGQDGLPAPNAELPTSGRRLAYARHLTRGDHPLLGRVLVNRIWMHHFGQGIVRTPSDFGVQGDPPTHPELLDWLAGQFVRSGWRLKPFHKLLMTSTAYQQASTRTAQLETVDPDNRLLGRMNMRRLDAETVRDTMLSVSGNLNETMFGPPLPVAADGVGRVLIGIASGSRSGRVKPLPGDESLRRSIYVQRRRSLPLAALATFDAPTMSPNCEQRSSSTVASQSLLLMNNSISLRQAEQFAARVAHQAGTDAAAQVRLAWQTALARHATPAQLERSLKFLEVQTQLALERAAELSPDEASQVRFASEPELQALANLCQFLFSSNAFLYVD